MNVFQIGVAGDFSEKIVAHRAINECFALNRGGTGASLQPVWLATERILPGDHRQFEGFQGIWCAPGSPYRNTRGALWAIEFARTRRIPFLGTCGGFQHALLEYARDVLGETQAEHAEERPETRLPLVHRMQCSIIEESQTVLVMEESFRSLYGGEYGSEGFHCSYGLNPKYEPLFSGSALKIVARAGDGQARAVRLEGHPFFVGTQFQPERKALTGELHPLIRAFFEAVGRVTLSSSH